MRVAVIVTNVGSPGTLASTSFVTALMDGFARVGTRARVVGLARSERGWQPAALGSIDASTPWLAPPSHRLGDRLDAARLGILDEDSATEVADAKDGLAWYRELLLQRELQRIAGMDRDLVVMVYPRSYPHLRPVCRIAKRRGWKVIVFANEALTDKQIDPASRDAYVRCVSTCSDGIWAASSYLQQYWADHGVAHEHILVSPSIVSTEAFVDGAPPRTNSAIYIGNLAHREIDYLLDISESARRVIPGFRLTVYGDATVETRQAIEADVERRELSGVVTLATPVLPFDMPGVLLGADVLVLPRSSGEFSAAGFPKKLGEYLATGRPVVVTRVGDIPKYLRDAESAFLVEPDDCSAFSDALVRALREPKLADKVGAGGRIFARTELASEVVAGRVVAFMMGLARRKRERASARTRWSRLRRVSDELRGPAMAAVHSTTYLLLHTRQGHTRLVALKMAVMSVLRRLHIKPPESDS